MKAASGALIAHINTLRTGDAKALVADLYSFTLKSGLVLTYTNADVPIFWNGYTYLANSILVDGLRYKCSAGLDVDQQQITISARSTDTIGGVPFLQALRNGVFDGCAIQRERAFLADWHTAPIGTVILFKGRIGTIDKIGRTMAEVTVNSDLVLLDMDMPRNVYSPNCVHVLYDSGCGLVKSAFGSAGSVTGVSTNVAIAAGGDWTAFTQGTVAFTSGANNGVTGNIKHGYVGGFTLGYPLLNVPSIGDLFTAYQGCDHTKNTCEAKFDNLANFRGFPFIPPPTHAF